MTPTFRQFVIATVLILLPAFALLLLLPKPYGIFALPYALVMAAGLVTARHLRSRSAGKRPAP